MIKFRHNDMMDRHEVDFETKLGNLDQVVTVAVIDKDNAITVTLSMYCFMLRLFFYG